MVKGTTEDRGLEHEAWEGYVKVKVMAAEDGVRRAGKRAREREDREGGRGGACECMYVCMATSCWYMLCRCMDVWLTYAGGVGDVRCGCPCREELGRQGEEDPCLLKASWGGVNICGGDGEGKGGRM